MIVAGCGGAPGTGASLDAAATEAAVATPGVDVGAESPIGAAGTGGAGPGVVAADAFADAQDAGSVADTGPSIGGGNSSSKVLIYGVTTSSFRHDSIPAAAKALSQAMVKAGLTAELVGVSNDTNKVDQSKFTAEALAQYGAIVLLAIGGEPFGNPADTEIQNLVDYVRGGGALVGVETAAACYSDVISGPMIGHPTSPVLHGLIGGTFAGHADLGPAVCTKVGGHPSVAQLAPSFRLVDEIYTFVDFRMDNQIVLNCVSGILPNMVRPISWYREEGAGRVFYTGLGHLASAWTGPMDSSAESRLVEDHLLPGLLWSMKRSP